MRGIETIRRETSDGQTSDIRHQTGSVACGVGSTCGVLHGGGRFLDSDSTLEMTGMERGLRNEN